MNYVIKNKKLLGYLDRKMVNNERQIKLNNFAKKCFKENIDKYNKDNKLIEKENEFLKEIYHIVDREKVND